MNGSKKIKNSQRECKCGCGAQFQTYDKKGRERSYIHGHNNIKVPTDVIFEKIIIDDNECWLWQGYKQKTGHGQLTYRNKRYFAHRFSYMIFRGDPSGKYINHKCDVPSCVNPDHLYAGTPHDNVKDMVFRYRHPNLKMIHSDEKIVKIKEMYKTGKYKQRQLAEMFEVNQSLISSWVNNKKRPFAGCEINPDCLGGE